MSSPLCRSGLVRTIVIVLSARSVPAQEWIETARCPPRPLALFSAPGKRFLGFSLDSKDRAIVFSAAAGAAPRTVPLSWGPSFVAYGQNVKGDRLCLPRRGSVETTVECWDADLRTRDAWNLPMPVESLALTGDEEAWIVPFHEPGVIPSLVEWRRGRDSVWRPSGRTFSIENLGAGGAREVLEIHPLDGKTIVIQSLMGSFDGVRITYPPAFLWSTDSGPLRRIESRSVDTSPELRRALSLLRGHPLRLGFRSAASQSRLAMIPALPLPDDRPFRHDEVWFRQIDRGEWETARVPAPVTAVALDGSDLFAATEDGRIWRRKTPLR